MYQPLPAFPYCKWRKAGRGKANEATLVYLPHFLFLLLYLHLSFKLFRCFPFSHSRYLETLKFVRQYWATIGMIRLKLLTYKPGEVYDVLHIVSRPWNNNVNISISERQHSQQCGQNLCGPFTNISRYTEYIDSELHVPNLWCATYIATIWHCVPRRKHVRK